MSKLNNYGLAGVGTAVRFGKLNGQITFDGTNGFRIRDQGNSADATLFVGSPTVDGHAVNKLYVDTYYVGTQSLTVSNGTFSLVLDTNPGLTSSNTGLKVDWTKLGTTNSVAGTDLVAISQSGIVVTTTAQNLVNSTVAMPATVAVANIVADGTNSTFNVGFTLPALTGLDTYITKATINIEQAFTGGSVSNAILSDGVNTIMVISENNISTPATYMSESNFGFTSTGSQCVITFLESDGVTPAIPTAGSATVAIEFSLSGLAGTGNVGGGISAIVAGAGLTGGTITTTGTIAIGTTGVTAGTYGNGSNVPVIVVNTLGQITAISTDAASSGGVTGPLVSTNQAIATFSGTTGGSIQNTNVTIDSIGNVAATGIQIGSSPNGFYHAKEVILYNSTTDATPTPLYLNGSFAPIVLGDDTTWLIELKVAARRVDAENESDVFWFAGAIDRQTGAATTAMVGTADTTSIEQSTNWSIAVSADTINGALKVQATGEAGKTIRWIGYLRIVEVIG